MNTRMLASIVLGGLTVFGVSTVAAQTDSTAAQEYELGPKSNYQTGCFGPCACPVLIQQPLSGSFILTFKNFDGLYNNYNVSNVHWMIPSGSSNLAILGSGTYRVGGEFAVQHQLSLDLSVGGQSPQHFDSGLVPGTNEFPRITIDIAAHDRMAACIDTIMHVEAAPYTTTGVKPGTPGSTVRRAAPNPFQQGTEVQLTLAHAGAVDLTIYDVRGGAVRHLAKGTWMDAGPRTISWDGRRDDHAACPAGVYFLRVTADGEKFVQRVVKAK